ncbi:MAG: arsenosugar biosynthesis radical SAM protein ArsS [Magnetococcales bacterium]|nr:arsenosugar biosynthesis radical SAM protein ArsS [Magnetococcales bacterium]
MNAFLPHYRQATGEPEVRCRGLNVIQANLGLTCNLACRHCHLGAGPERRESMSWPVMEALLTLARSAGSPRLELTGGAPELNPQLRRLIREARQGGLSVLVRSNLTVLLTPECGDLPEFFRDHGVGLVASMPCYLEENVNRQRGEGTYGQAVAALRRLNGLGYGEDPALPLDLVYNPGGAFLPGDQCALERDYKRELGERFGIVFTRLLTLANMPIGRFRADLRRQGRDGEYEALLRHAFNPAAAREVMCRDQVSVRWDGTLFDCDFNLALDLPLIDPALRRLPEAQAPALARRNVAVGDHCFGCTAGAGSSCRGALAA